MSNRTGTVVLAIVLSLLAWWILPYFRSPKKFVTYPVTGRITYADNGEPFTGAVLVSQVLSPPRGPRAYADLAADGSFILETELKNDGVVSGDQLLILNGKPPGGITALLLLVQPQYFDFDKTPWRVTVQPNRSNHFELTVERAKAAAPRKPSTDLLE